ncbi:hypothetical protein GE061_004963 [Apolygus lucorum]|uniref:Mab-21-like nucleotidyltransferase domain-containing protein n=1 Tax=Apolygus lucorum TaxID=248454 RepID=A0A8S9WUB6_APOLU|nr:hypothetical protein GE061_004963 [Apolygus lucorum]
MNDSSFPAPQMREEKFYKSLEAGLTQINNDCVAMNEVDKSASIKITLMVLDELIKKMKEASKLFEWLFNRITYVGSYFDGLRVKEATEFDINVVLKLPLLYDKVKIRRTAKYPGYVDLNLNEGKLSGEKLAKHQNETEEIFKWTKDGYLSHKMVLKWWESVFSKLQGATTLVVDNSEYMITAFKKSGPAMTAHISGKNVDIDVDLVPVIEFSKTNAPPEPIRWKNQVGEWFIVPKPIDENEFLWRLSFPEQEKKVMNGLNKLKVVNRLLKRMRDVFNWRPLSSYYIKSIFLWEAYERKEKDDATFFNKNLGYLLAYFLGKLQWYLEQQTLPFFWDKEFNLFHRINQPTLKGYAGRIRNVRTQIDKFLSESNTSQLEKTMRNLFYTSNASASSVNGSETNSQPDETFLLINLESSTSENNHQSPSSFLPADLFESTASSNLFVESFSQSSNFTSPSSESQDSAISTTSDSSRNYSVRCFHDLETSKEKSSLEIEECKLRVQIAEIDLETAKMNLRAAEKRYEKVVLEYNRMI